MERPEIEKYSLDKFFNDCLSKLILQKVNYATKKGSRLPLISNENLPFLITYKGDGQFYVDLSKIIWVDFYSFGSGNYLSIRSNNFKVNLSCYDDIKIKTKSFEGNLQVLMYYGSIEEISFFKKDYKQDVNKIWKSLEF